ncbi:hypothetical protein GF389_03370 [Candidatus Dojkabacteria bacterium]|nr:hypothetical protein [Candidatus Dojkabacteria bacterium]
MSHNPDKDDPVYFKNLLEKYNLKPCEVVYFDRKQEAINSAKSLGITTYFYDHEVKDLEALKDFLDNSL